MNSLADELLAVTHELEDVARRSARALNMCAMHISANAGNDLLLQLIDNLHVDIAASRDRAAILYDTAKAELNVTSHQW